ncbi:lytic transglycosylase [Spirochaetia bacterium]|nr:lytic transglycosylase [Spirochaetia bacterium]
MIAGLLLVPGFGAVAQTIPADSGYEGMEMLDLPVPPPEPAPLPRVVPGPTAGTGRPVRQYKEAGAFKGPLPEKGPYAGSGAGEPGIAGFDQALTQKYINQYSTAGGLQWLGQTMRRASPYLPFIRKEIEKRNLPGELIYLPVIESTYLATAVSKSGATGLWQFMKNSIAPFNIKVTDWTDERMDFWKSTEGALRKLEDNYKVLGDWPLALAAYNAGLGGINRIIKQSGAKDYWVLSEKKLLKTENIQYVPKLLAVSYILSNPRRFGLELDWSEDPQWKRITVEKQVDLELLAAEAGIAAAGLKEANRELLHGITPPAPYYLKVRAADAPAVTDALKRTGASLIRYHYHTVQYGDTLSALARQYGAPVEQISSANPGVQARYLQIGQRLRIPALREASTNLVSTKQGSTKPAAQIAEAKPGPAGKNTMAFTGTHLVKRGETLWSIALAYGVDPNVLAGANDMALSDILREGRSLKTPIRE